MALSLGGSSSPVIGARSVFGFDLNKPLRAGWLLKQGGSHKAFKKRFFVLYPGFLIYYNSPDKYKYDVARSTLAVSWREHAAGVAGEGVCCRILPPFAPLLPLSLPHSLLSPQSRIFAIKLKGAEIHTAKYPPKGCHFGFTVYAPDPLNKRW